MCTALYVSEWTPEGVPSPTRHQEESCKVGQDTNTETRCFSDHLCHTRPLPMTHGLSSKGVLRVSFERFEADPGDGKVVTTTCPRPGLVRSPRDPSLARLRYLLTFPRRNISLLCRLFKVDLGTLGSLKRRKIRCKGLSFFLSRKGGLPGSH